MRKILKVFLSNTSWKRCGPCFFLWRRGPRSSGRRRDQSKALGCGTSRHLVSETLRGPFFLLLLQKFLSYTRAAHVSRDSYIGGETHSEHTRPFTKNNSRSLATFVAKVPQRDVLFQFSLSTKLLGVLRVPVPHSEELLSYFVSLDSLLLHLLIGRESSLFLSTRRQFLSTGNSFSRLFDTLALCHC